MGVPKDLLSRYLDLTVNSSQTAATSPAAPMETFTTEEDDTKPKSKRRVRFSDVPPDVREIARHSSDQE